MAEGHYLLVVLYPGPGVGMCMYVCLHICVYIIYAYLCAGIFVCACACVNYTNPYTCYYISHKCVLCNILHLYRPLLSSNAYTTPIPTRGSGPGVAVPQSLPGRIQKQRQSPQPITSEK